LLILYNKTFPVSEFNSNNSSASSPNTSLCVLIHSFKALLAGNSCKKFVSKEACLITASAILKISKALSNAAI
jgi:hypothetical protein